MMSLLHSIMPATQLAPVKAALLSAFNTDDVTSVTMLSGGLSDSAVYKISVNGHGYVLKLGPSTTIDISTQTNLSLASAAGVAPSLRYEDKAQGISISDFINNQPVRHVFPPDKLPGELAQTIKAIHNIPCHTKGNDLFTTVDVMIDRFRTGRMLSGPVFDECFRYYALMRSNYHLKEEDQVFSHNDLNPGNILCDGKKIWIIDWDAAFVNDRYVDLANAANFFIHSEEHEHLFLTTYFGTIDDRKTARFYIMRQVCRIIYALLMFDVASGKKSLDHSHDQTMEGITLKEFNALMRTGQLQLSTYEGQFMYGKALLNEAVHHMRTPRFSTSLEKLA